MTDYVVDTNVWVMADKPNTDLTTLADLNCRERCFEWLSAFMGSLDRLVVDWGYKILGEYRDNFRSGGTAIQWLNELERKPVTRLVITYDVRFDDDGHAIVPPHVSVPDASDRKFVAVALAHNPRPMIVNATDADWAENRQQLEAAGIQVKELCAEQEV